MYCEYCTQCGASAGNTKFAKGCSNFKHKTIKLHNESIKHRLCRDACMEWGKAPLDADFKQQEAASRASEMT